jgi:hypothetical protein
MDLSSKFALHYLFMRYNGLITGLGYEMSSGISTFDAIGFIPTITTITPLGL